jgi:hypothetical protein
MLQAFMLAEGDDRRRFANGDRHMLHAFQILCALEGIATGKEKPHHGIWLQRLKLTRQLAGNFLHLEPAAEQPAWCPTTVYGTWVMRQNRRVMITGNTKAKRRVTLSICGLGWLDESEVETVPRARPVQVGPAGEIEDAGGHRPRSVTPVLPAARSSPKSQPVRADRAKLLRRWAALCKEADALDVEYDPLPPDASESTITEFGVALKQRVADARARRAARAPAA